MCVGLTLRSLNSWREMESVSKASRTTHTSDIDHHPTQLVRDRQPIVIIISKVGGFVRRAAWRTELLAGRGGPNGQSDTDAPHDADRISMTPCMHVLTCSVQYFRLHIISEWTSLDLVRATGCQRQESLVVGDPMPCNLRLRRTPLFRWTAGVELWSVDSDH